MSICRIKIQQPSEANFEPIRLFVSAKVRYWEDAVVNGKSDDEYGTLIPMRYGRLWKPTIDLATGRILGWPDGTSASIHYKVCDGGQYWLQDLEGRTAKYSGEYVPDGLLCMGDVGFGDYIILSVRDDGTIFEWNPRINGSEWKLTDGGAS